MQRWIASPAPKWMRFAAPSAKTAAVKRALHAWGVIRNVQPYRKHRLLAHLRWAKGNRQASLGVELA
ncbi:hypothetical protein [Pseudomonas laurentiana]